MNRETFLARKAKSFPVTLDDGDVVQVRRLSQAEVTRLNTEFFGKGPEQAAAGMRFLVTRTLLDDQGERMFTDEQIDEVGELVDFTAIDTIADEVLKLAGYNAEKKPEPSAAGPQADAVAAAVPAV